MARASSIVSFERQSSLSLCVQFGHDQYFLPCLGWLGAHRWQAEGPKLKDRVGDVWEVYHREVPYNPVP